MARLFGGRKQQLAPEPSAVRPGPPDAQEPQTEPSVVAMLAAELRKTSGEASPEQELLEQIGAFRSAVADALYEISEDYRMLCNLTHANIDDCHDLIEALRRRLTSDVHYAVLAKLDEAYALTEARVGGTPERR